MGMKIEFGSGNVLEGGPGLVTLVMKHDDYMAIRQVLTHVALVEAKMNNVAFANDLLYLNTQLEEAVVSPESN